MPTALGIISSAFVPAAAGGETFPVIESTNTETGTSLGTSNAMPSPAGVVSGNLLLAFVSEDGSTAVSASTGWTQVAQRDVNGTTHLAAVFARLADGGANDTLAVTGATQDYCCVIARISSHSVSSIGSDIKSAVTFNTNSVPDAPSLNAGSSRKWLWFAVVGVDTAAAYTLTPPSSYSQVASYLQSATNISGSALSVASRTNETGTEDPGAFGTGGARPWAGITVAVPPATS